MPKACYHAHIFSVFSITKSSESFSLGIYFLILLTGVNSALVIQNGKEVKVVKTLPDKLFTPLPLSVYVVCLLMTCIHVFFQSSWQNNKSFPNLSPLLFPFSSLPELRFHF